MELEDLMSWEGSIIELIEELKPEDYTAILDEYEGEAKEALKKFYQLKKWDLFLYTFYKDELLFQVKDGEIGSTTDNYYRLWNEARRMLYWGKYDNSVKDKNI